MPDDRPNILLIMTDQQRGDCLGVEGHPVLQTPQMDELAGQGTRFSRAYSTCPVSIPARRSLMSGQFPATHGMVGYRDGVDWDPPATLPGELAKAGYQTAIVGRNMHLHPVRKRYGFDQMVIQAGHLGRGDYERWLDAHQPAGAGGFMGGGVTNNDWTARPFHMADHLHPTHWTVNEALRYLEARDPSCPYFLVVSFAAPHPPFTPPAFYLERYLRTGVPDPYIGDWCTRPQTDPPYAEHENRVDSPIVNLTGEALLSARAGYYGLINHVDDQIRRILTPVGNPAGRNTVVLFTSDHGEMLGDHYLFRKGQPYEGSARVPLLVRGPAELGFGRGQVIDQPVCLEDIMPTCLDIAGAATPGSVEGRSLLPLLRGEQPLWRDYLHGEHSHGRSTHSNHFLTDGRMKYVWLCHSGREQLFDLQADPGECHNLAALPERAEALTLWRSRLIEHLKDRPEGFSDGKQLVPGRPYEVLLPHAQAQ